MIVSAQDYLLNTTSNSLSILCSGLTASFVSRSDEAMVGDQQLIPEKEVCSRDNGGRNFSSLEISTSNVNSL